MPLQVTRLETGQPVVHVAMNRVDPWLCLASFHSTAPMQLDFREERAQTLPCVHMGPPPPLPLSLLPPEIKFVRGCHHLASLDLQLILPCICMLRSLIESPPAGSPNLWPICFRVLRVHPAQRVFLLVARLRVCTRPGFAVQNGWGLPPAGGQYMAFINVVWNCTRDIAMATSGSDHSVALLSPC